MCVSAMVVLRSLKGVSLRTVKSPFKGVVGNMVDSMFPMAISLVCGTPIHSQNLGGVVHQ